MNREVRFPDNAWTPVQPILMRHEDSSKGSRLTKGTWLRPAIVGLWVGGFVLVGAVLFARWDVLMARLARPPVADLVVEGVPR